MSQKAEQQASTSYSSISIKSLLTYGSELIVKHK